MRFFFYRWRLEYIVRIIIGLAFSEKNLQLWSKWEISGLCVVLGLDGSWIETTLRTPAPNTSAPWALLISVNVGVSVDVSTDGRLAMKSLDDAWLWLAKGIEVWVYRQLLHNNLFTYYLCGIPLVVEETKNTVQVEKIGVEGLKLVSMKTAPLKTPRHSRYQERGIKALVKSWGNISL